MSSIDNAADKNLKTSPAPAKGNANSSGSSRSSASAAPRDAVARRSPSFLGRPYRRTENAARRRHAPAFGARGRTRAGRWLGMRRRRRRDLG